MRSDRFVMQQACEADSAEILSVLEENPLPGPISLIYTRRPDAYRSFMAEGCGTYLFVCRDMQEGRIAGLGAGVIHECLVEHLPEKMVYLFGLRIRQEYLAKRVLVMLPGAYRSLVEHFQSQGVRHFLTAVLADNLPALRMLTRDRSRLPRYTFLCPYHTMVFLTRRRAPSLPGSFAFRRATSADRSSIQDFLSAEGGHCDFFPSGPGGLFGPPEGLSWESFRLLTDRQGRILACGAVWDQTKHKQYVVAGYNGALRWLHLVSPLLRLLGYPPMPRLSSIVPFFIMAFWCVRENRQEHLKWFLDSLAWDARDYPYFVMGVPEAHPLGPTLNKWRFLGYDSHIYMVGDHVTAEDAARLGKSPYLECGWL